MSRFLKKTMRLFCVYDLYGFGGKKQTAGRNLDRVARVMEQQPQNYFFTSAFDSVGKQINLAMRKGLNV